MPETKASTKTITETVDSGHSADSDQGHAPDNGASVVTIKKYANRRLYNTATSSYVTLDTLAAMVKDGIEFGVFDAKSGEDITRQVLTHIIVEEESKGTNLLPIGFLRHLISFYGDSLQSVVPNYLESSMQSFAKNQEQMRTYMRDTLGGINPFGAFDEMNKQNMAMFERTMRLFSPFPGVDGDGDSVSQTPANRSTPAPGPESGPESGPEVGPKSGPELGTEAALDPTDNRLADLQSKLEAMQKQLDALSAPETGQRTGQGNSRKRP